MKKANVLGLVSLLLVLMMGLSFTSCSDDDDDASSSASIIGQWKMVSYSGFDAEDKEDMDAQIAAGATYTFNEGGKGTIYASGVTFPFNYSQTGDKITLTGDIIEGVMTIVKLTSSELSIKDEDGAQINFKKK